MILQQNSTNALFHKIENYVTHDTLKPIHFVIFDSHINYANLIWGHNSNFKLRIITLHENFFEYYK